MTRVVGAALGNPFVLGGLDAGVGSRFDSQTICLRTPKAPIACCSIYDTTDTGVLLRHPQRQLSANETPVLRSDMRTHVPPENARMKRWAICQMPAPAHLVGRGCIPTLGSLARQFVDGQQMIANLTRSANTVRTSAPDDPAVRKLLADFEATTNHWLTQALPSLAASMKVAIEVYETFGGGMTTDRGPNRCRNMEQQVLRLGEGTQRPNALSH